jgi:polyisoprenoid-binding protein YceI
MDRSERKTIMNQRGVSAVAALEHDPAPTPKAVTGWDIDHAHTELGFRVRHLMVSHTRGHFRNFSGSLEYNPNDVSSSKVSIRIEAASIDTNNQDRDQHLRSADFFDTEKYPFITFESSKVEQVQGRLRLTGSLSMHGISKTVILEADPLSPASKDPWGNLHFGTHATARLNRKDFGLVWNKLLETGGVAVGDEVELMLEIEFVRKP